MAVEIGSKFGNKSNGTFRHLSRMIGINMLAIGCRKLCSAVRRLGGLSTLKLNVGRLGRGVPCLHFVHFWAAPYQKACMAQTISHDSRASSGRHDKTKSMKRSAVADNDPGLSFDG